MKKILLFLLVVSMGCSSPDQVCIDAPELETLVDVKIVRLENRLFAAETPRDVLNLLEEYPALTKEFLGADQYPSDTVLARELFRIIKNPYTDTLLMETEAYFGDMKDLEEEFSRAFSYIKLYYPEFEAPRITTMVTGFGSAEMYVDQNEIIIGLDYYLGPQGKYRPQGIPEYILRRYDKPYIVPATVLLYADRFLREDPSDNTMAADMIYYGKKFLFAKNMMPCAPDSVIVWYDGEELANVEENRHLLWYHFLENELVYETNHTIKQKYLDERPNVYEIGNKCPGRIGAWIGWDIMKTYQEGHEDISLQEILANPDAKQLLNDAKYNPF
jgi:hypothetical protein